MNKTFFLLPVAAGILTACSSHPPAPVVNAEGSDLSPGIMEPIQYSGAMDNSYGWQPPIQATSMPSTMPQPIYQPAPVPTVVPQVPPPQPVVSAQQAVQPVVQQATTVSPASTAKVDQDFKIPRDQNNAPIYSQINKGFYNGDTYTVRKGDTMFLIAYIAGKDVTEIARLNNMSEPYKLYIGQKLKLGNPVTAPQTSSSAVTTAPAQAAITYTPAPNGTAYGSDGTVTGPIKAGTATKPAPRPVAQQTTMSPASKTNTPPPATSPIKWNWPTEGNIIAGFSESDGGNKGIDIAGNKGQAIKAAAAGRVVYAGSHIPGYGNMIIINHSNEFLSTYAHNDTIKVKEQDNVKAGQTIATMGSTGTNSNKLHFEIRHMGKSVDPTRYLPK